MLSQPDYARSAEEWISERLGQQDGFRQERDFIIRTEYQLDRLLKSGLVVKNRLSAYAESVADSLLYPDTITRKKIRFYTLLSSQANAWTFDRGVILITTGLFARLHNETELAFIIAHELAHYREKHARSTYVFQNCDDLTGCSAPKMLSQTNSYSRENEMQADKDAYELLRKKGYDLGLIMPVFDILQYDYLPLSEKKFDKHFFEDQHLRLPRQFTLGLLNPIRPVDDSHDTSSTHPSLTKRRLNMRLLLADRGGADLSPQNSSDQCFQNMKVFAVSSFCETQLVEGNYYDAFYNSFTQQDSSSNSYERNRVFEEIRQAALYGIALSKSSFSAGNSPIGYEHIQGQLQQVYYFFSKLTAVEATVLALHYNWNSDTLYRFSSHERITRTENLLALLTGLHKMKRSEFSSELPPPEKAAGDISGDIRGEVHQSRPSYNFHLYALGGMLKNEWFAARFAFYEDSASGFIDRIISHAPVNNVYMLPAVVRIYGDKDKEFFAAEERWKQAWESAAENNCGNLRLTLPALNGERAALEKFMSLRILSAGWLMERQANAVNFFPPAYTGCSWTGYAQNKGEQIDYLLLTGIIYRSRFKTDDIIVSDAKERRFARKRVACYALLYEVKTGRLLLNEQYSKKKKMSRRLIGKWSKQLMKQVAAA